MATHVLDIKQWPAFLKKLGLRAHDARMRGVLSGAQRGVQLMQRRTETAVPASARGGVGAFNTGNYRGRWRSRPLSNGAMIYNDSNYAGIIDEGRRVGGRMVPLIVIQRWAQRRLQMSVKEAKRAAWPMAKAIQKRGLRPRRVMSGAIDQLKQIMRDEIARELRAELRK